MQTKSKPASRAKTRPATPAEARRSLKALDIMSGRAAEPPEPRKRGRQREAEIQKAVFEWARLSSGRHPELRLMHHIANEGKRDMVAGHNLKLQGLKAGLPDISLPVARGRFHGLYIELKSEGGRLRENQKEWLADLARQGYKAIAAYGFEEAVEEIEQYLNLKG